jgi:predicted anti-sigma-YlaC factor YlaD
MLYEYLDNELPLENEAALFIHLASCASCRAEFKAQRLIDQEMKRNMPRAPETIREHVLQSQPRRERQSTGLFARGPIPAMLPYAFAACVIVLLLFSFFQIYALKNELSSMKTGYQVALERVYYQTQQMNLLMNNMPVIQVTGHPTEY